MTRRRRRSPENSTEPTYKNNANPTPMRVFHLHQVQHQHHRSKPNQATTAPTLVPETSPVSIHPPLQLTMQSTILALLLAISAAVSAAPIPQNQGPFDGLVSQLQARSDSKKSYLTFEQGHESQRRRECTDRRRAGPSSWRGERCLGVDGRCVVCSL
jgi:hypothetical protein